LLEIDSGNEEVYQGVKNAVYRAGFSTDQSRMRKQLPQFPHQEVLEQRLDRLYWIGERMTLRTLAVSPRPFASTLLLMVAFKCKRSHLWD